MKLGNIIFIARFAAIVIILFLIDFEQLVHIFRSINFDLLILAILLELAGFLIWTLKWKLIIGKLEKVKFTTLFLGLMSGNCLNTNVLRARTFGGFGRAMFLKNITKDHGHGNWYATVAIDQTTNGFVFSIPVIFSLLFVILFLNIPRWLSILLEIIAIILLILSVFVYISKQRIKKSTIVGFFYSTLKRIYEFSLCKFIRKRYSYQKFEELVITGLNEFEKTYRSIYMFFVIFIAYAATVIMRLFHIGDRAG